MNLCRIDTDVATLLLAVVAVDSANLENATQRDLDVVEVSLWSRIIFT